MGAALSLDAAGGSDVWIGAAQQRLPGSWQAQYALFSGVRSGSLQGTGDLAIAVQTDSGALTVTVTNAAGDTLLAQSAAADAVWLLEDPGPVRLTLRGNEHSGGFSAAYGGAAEKP